ncbi:hypothetical protein [Clostridium sp. JN-1]|uniref:hypothetical protein n=1 Tax=Clostridium sp. JN-1 TaxID=2483110 RepID=UPI001681A752|nr:hypothetical protein [Clostridium sp. JN-1]
MSLPRYVINFDELEAELRFNLLKLIDAAMKNKYPQLDTGDIESLMAEIEDLLPDEKYRKLKNKIRQFVTRKYNGDQKVNGALIYIPAIRSDYKQDFIFDEDVYLTGFNFDQTGWKKEDRYSLSIDEEKIIDCATTKEIGEHKYFNTYYYVNADIPVSFILHNISGNSRQALVDLEYLTAGSLPPSGSTIIFLDVSGSMRALLKQMSALMLEYLQNLYDIDKVSLCFVSGIEDKYKHGTYFFKRKDFEDKYKAIDYLSVDSNIPLEGGGTYDIVTVQCVIDYNIRNFDNYIFCTDQVLESDPIPDFIDKLKKFFNKDQNVFSLPVDKQNENYWKNEFEEIKLFKPIKP